MIIAARAFYTMKIGLQFQLPIFPQWINSVGLAEKKTVYVNVELNKL